MSFEPDIHIKGAREHNLKNLELRIPRGKLVVITGVSGSGKSSLAFDTIYAEGYRKYIESLSTHARQVLEQLKRPDVDFIHGLSPVLAIEQRTGGGSPRSMVATVTELADYARLLWALEGEAFCPKDGGRIIQQSLDSSIERLLSEPTGSRAMILAPWMKTKPAVLRNEISGLKQRGFQRIRIAGEIKNLDDEKIIPTGNREIPVDLVIDRVVIDSEQRSRLADSLELAFREGSDRAFALIQEKGSDDWTEIGLSRNLSCDVCGEVHEALSPRRFSFNSTEGACPTCGGIGKQLTFVEELVIADPSKPVKKGAIKPFRIGGKALIIRNNALMKQLAEFLPFDPDTPWNELPGKTRKELLYGTGDRLFRFKVRRSKKKIPDEVPFIGIIPMLDKAKRETKSDGFRARLSTFQISDTCPTCDGSRLSPTSSAVLVDNVSLPEFLAMDISSAYAFMAGLHKKDDKTSTRGEVLEGIVHRLEFLNRVGLDYLTLNREYTTLSGGEAQRVRLATQLGMGLVGVIYVLDEPSVGLHARDNQNLIRTLVELRDRGNSVLVVEHDEETMLRADQLIELGPGAGTAGGRLLFQGTPDECMKTTAKGFSTGAFLSGAASLEKDGDTKRPDNRLIEIAKASHNNLKNVDVVFPVGLLTCVTGVSGSGKSTLVNDVLAKAAARKLNRSKVIPGSHKGLNGLDFFEKVVQVDQEPIGRSPRSNPATYTKLFDFLRDLYSKCPLSKVRGYKAGRFSFNMRGGRCERCQGDGVIKLDMMFMSNAYTECPSCHGKRYNRETLEVRFGGYSIADVLGMTVSEAASIFRNIPRMVEKLDTLKAVGLGYLQLGQPAPTLSGGEAQRLKLSLELSKRQQGRNLYILDEPTTGLHWADIQNLMELLFRLRDGGNTIIVIEHHLDVIAMADWIVDLGPEGGNKGGELVHAGTVKSLISCKRSLTGQALKEWKDRK